MSEGAGTAATQLEHADHQHSHDADDGGKGAR
jgi:hypothetical protein